MHSGDADGSQDRWRSRKSRQPGVGPCNVDGDQHRTGHFDIFSARVTALVSSWQAAAALKEAANIEGGRLCNNDQTQKAQDWLMKYHGSGVLTPVVQLEYDQILKSVQAAREKGLKRWDSKHLANTRAHRYRLMLGESH